MKFIKQDSITNVLEEARIYDVVAAFEDLKKKGTHHFCMSPFSGEKGTPSFCVNSVKNSYYDYSSGFGGNAVNFLMKKLSIGFFDAIEKAAAICNITLEYEEQSEDAKKINDEFQSMKKLVDFAAEKYQVSFHKLPAEHWAKELMIQQREFSEDTLQQFEIGFAPNERSFISTPAINGGNFELSKTLGYTITKDGASYDFFRNRIIFPIHNERGDIVGFGGRRSNDEEDEKYAKYMNSKESKLYLKDKVLYGLWQAKKTIVASGKAILLEGYTDVMALHQFSATNAVASCGTAFTEYQAKLLSRFCKHVILFRDGDAAGTKAAHRDLDVLLKASFKVEIVICPAGEDPDSLARKTDINAFIEKNKEDAILWRAKVLQKDTINPELISLEKTLREALDKEIEDLRAKMITDESIDSLSNAMDKKFAKNENAKLFKQIHNLEKEMLQQLSDFPKYEPRLVSEAVEAMSNTLHLIPNKIAQKEYVKMVSKILDQKPKVLEDIIKYTEDEEALAKKQQSKQQDKQEYEILGLPEGADKDQFLRDRFCVVENAYWFRRDSNFMRGTNFRAEALFHVEGRKENKRLCEIINTLGHKRLIDFDSKDLINFTKFQERLIMEGFFVFEPGASTSDFKLLTNFLFSDFITAKELKLLGLQSQGFFAFADCVYHDGNVQKVNKYGIVNIEGLEKTDSEYRNDITHFYSPSHSEIYKHESEGDDPYENDRHFVHKEAPVSLDQWMSQMVKVFGDKGKLGVAFALASNFRDLFLQHYNSFPLMCGIGQKDSGKSGFGSCIQSFFYFNLNPLDLNTSTLPSLSRKVSRCKNTVVFCDEYREDIDGDMFQLLKSAWNGFGREKGNGFDSLKTTAEKVNSAIYYAGQYLPIRDDGALISRSIICNFENKEHSPEQKEEYNKLIAWNKLGLSSFIIDIIKHRDFVTKNLIRVYSETVKELKKSLKDFEYQNRIFDNYAQILVIVKMLDDKFNFPFKYAEFFELVKDSIVENSETIADSDGLAAFWRVVEYLSNPGSRDRCVKQGEDYIIEREPSFKIMIKKGEFQEWKNKDNDKILFLNFSKVHQDYHKESSKRQGEEVIAQSTIRNYIKSKKYFIGLYTAKRIGDKTTSGYALNYSLMERMNILNLPDENEKQSELEIDLPEGF